MIHININNVLCIAAAGPRGPARALAAADTRATGMYRYSSYGTRFKGQFTLDWVASFLCERNRTGSLCQLKYILFFM